MKRLIVTIILLPLAGCFTVQMAGPPPAACVPKWPTEFANRLAAEADAMPADAASREALAQLAELRKALPRC